jgi:ribosome-binding factor A
MNSQHLLQIFRNCCVPSRLLSTTAPIYGQKHVNPTRQSRIMSKLIGTHKEKRKFYGATESSERKMPVLQSASSFSNPSGASKSTLRRIQVLNKLFMRNITDLMATGEVSTELLGKGLQISRVKITQDFRSVHVFWLCQGTEDDDSMEATLKDIAGRLRHELAQLRLMGEVPKIFFVKDKQYAKFAEVDSLLAKADFGDDYTPTDPSYRLKSDFQLEYQLSSATRFQIETMDNDLDVPQTSHEEPMPVMQHNVLGLDRDLIMKRIKGNVRKSEEAWRNYEATNSPATEAVAAGSVQESVAEVSEKEKEFARYLQKQSYSKKDKSGKNMLDKLTMDYIRDEQIAKLSKGETRIETEDVDYIVEDEKSGK